MDRRDLRERMEVLYEDGAVIVCYKPAGLATETAGLGQQDLVSLLRSRRAARGEEPYIGTVHRLDQPAEGLLAFAKTRQAAAVLSLQVRERGIGKYYRAIGQPEHGIGDYLRKTGQSESGSGCGRNPAGRKQCRIGQDHGTADPKEQVYGEQTLDGWTTWIDYICFDRKRNLSVIADRDTPQAKRAQLSFRVLGQKEGLTCFEIKLHTGRHHQIRVQMAHHGFPLVGDARYGIKEEEGTQLALCACRLRFVHPTTKREMDFSIRPRNPVFEPFTETIPEYIP